MKAEKGKVESTEVVKTESEKGAHATQIFVFWQDGDGEKGITDFQTKPALDKWLEETSVTVLKVIRGRERKISRRIVFQ